MKKLLSIIACLIACLLFLGCAIPKDIATAATEYKGMVVIEQNTKRVLDEYQKDLRLPMASTTKIMTALVVLENCKDLDKQITIDDRVVGVEGTSMYLRKGEKLTTRELLCGMLLPSGNDAATALALSICEDMQSFASLMNQKAQDLGLKNSQFKNSHGLDEDGHYTSAYDLAVITCEAMKHPQFLEIISQKNIQVTGAGGDQGDIRFLRNKNRLLTSYPFATGVKTGFTDNAGRCFVASSSKGNLSLICVVLNCPTMFESAQRLLDKAYNNYNMVELLPAYNCYRKISVVDGNPDEVKLYTKRGFAYPLSVQETAQICYEYQIPDNLVAPIKKEQKVGCVVISLAGKELFREDIYAVDEIKSLNFLYNFKDIIKNWF